MLRARMVAGAVAGLVVSTSAACSGEDPGASLPDLGEIAENPSTAELELALDAYGPTPTERATLDTAEDAFITDCMAAEGFTFEPPPRIADDDETHRNRYMVIDPDAAATHGYRKPPDPNAEALLEHQQSTPMTPAETIAFFGREGGGGCLAAAAAELGTDTRQDDTSFIDGLGLESYNESLTDPRVQEAFDAWSKCMAVAGYDYDTPLEANNDERWVEQAAAGDDGEPAPSAAEIAAATADVSCKHDANVAGIWMAVENAYQNELIDEAAAELDAIRNRTDRALAAAAEVVEGRDR